MKSLIRGYLGQKFAQFSNLEAPIFKYSYSQFGEDIQIQRFVQGVRGLYLDIGSGHPIKGNNTYALYKDGWRGVLVEPILEFAKLSKKLRPKEIFINGVMGAEPGRVDFYQFEPYQYSTILPTERNLRLSQGIKLTNKFEVDVVNLKFILNLMPGYPHVISIDAEGSDFVVLDEILTSQILPLVFCIEDFQPEETSKIHERLINTGYYLAARIYPSSIYVIKK